MADRTNTGGVMEFSHSKEDMEKLEADDTKYTKEFKQALYVKRFFEGKATRQEVEKYAPFHTLTVKVLDRKDRPVKHHIDVGYEIGPGRYRRIEKKDIAGTYSEELPENKYKVMISVRRLLFLKKKVRKFMQLDQDMEEVIIV